MMNQRKQPVRSAERRIRSGLVAGLTTPLILAALQINPAAVVAAPADDPAQFCASAQSVISRTQQTAEVIVHEDFEAFVRSKSSIDPLTLHAYQWTGPGDPDRVVAISCKMRSADHLNAVYGEGTAGADGLCQDVNRETLRSVGASLGTVPEVVFDADEDVFNDENPQSSGRIWLAPFRVTSADAAGRLQVHSAGFRVDWQDQRFAAYDGRVRGVHYCHLIAPSNLRAVLAGDAEPGAVIGHVVIPGGAIAPTALRFSTVNGAGGVPLNVAEAGPAGAPGILLLHGFSQTHLSFETQLTDPALTRLFHVVAPDLRGHGNSGKPWDADAYTGETFAADVEAVLQATGLTRPVIVAWSFGGLVAMHYIRHYGADRIAGLNLVGTTGRLVPMTAQAPPPEMNEWMRQMLSGSLADNLKAAAVSLDMLTARPMPVAWRKRMLQAAMTMPVYAKRAIGVGAGDNADLAAGLTIPVLLSAGDKDRISPADSARAAAAVLPNARLSIYPEAGHSPFVEEPTRFNRELMDFADP